MPTIEHKLAEMPDPYGALAILRCSQKPHKKLTQKWEAGLDHRTCFIWRTTPEKSEWWHSVFVAFDLNKPYPPLP